jgi:hypothetical protein
MTCGSRRRHLAPSLTRSKNCVAWHYIVRILRTLTSVDTDHQRISHADSLFSYQGAVGRGHYDRLDDIRTRRGDGRARTGDPLLAKQVLSQLSYIPEVMAQESRRRRAWAFLDSNQRPHGYQPCALTN